MKKILTLLILCVSVTLIAQNGINYKAIIKDDLGNVIVSQNVTIQFTILEGATNVYLETHTPSTDANGLIVVNIGEGTTSDVFTDINWSADDHFLNVQIDTGSGLVDLGTTQFMHVPYAIQAANVTGLEAIDEGNGVGWRLIDSDSANYGTIGFNAVDLSHSDLTSSIYGATGTNSTAMGIRTTANGYSSTALGSGTTASQDFSTAIGSASTASGMSSTAIGIGADATGDSSLALGIRTEASGLRSTAIGNHTIAEAAFSTAIGSYNVGGGNPTAWNYNEPLFEIGNGTSEATRSNALTVYKNGSHRINASGYSGLTVDGGSFGIVLRNSVFSGLSVDNPAGHGVYVYDSGSDGIFVDSAGLNGALLIGNTSGVHAESTISNNPDIILGGNSSANGGDVAIISSDPAYGSSGFHIRSYDDVIVELDYNNSEFSFFRVMNGDNEDVFSVSEGGAIRQNGATIHSSDKRLKKDIENLEYGLDEILQLQPKAYRWKNKNQTEKSLGLIAQDVQPIIKEIVVAQDDADKTLGISYTELIPVLIKAIQEQQKIIDNQNTNYTSLLERIEILENNKSN